MKDLNIYYKNYLYHSFKKKVHRYYGFNLIIVDLISNNLFLFLLVTVISYSKMLCILVNCPIAFWLELLILYDHQVSVFNIYIKKYFQKIKVTFVINKIKQIFCLTKTYLNLIFLDDDFVLNLLLLDKILICCIQFEPYHVLNYLFSECNGVVHIN